jgi:hypothetical protein
MGAERLALRLRPTGKREASNLFSAARSTSAVAIGYPGNFLRSADHCFTAKKKTGPSPSTARGFFLFAFRHGIESAKKLIFVEILEETT